MKIALPSFLDRPGGILDSDDYGSGIASRDFMQGLEEFARETGRRTWRLTWTLGLPLLCLAPFAGRRPFAWVCLVWILLLAALWIVSGLVLAVGSVIFLAVELSKPPKIAPQAETPIAPPPAVRPRISAPPPPCPKCPVCFWPIRRSGVASECSRCGLAHHEECWDLLGKCARYACGSRKSMPVTGKSRP